MRVALDCDIASLPALRRGLQSLSQADPCVEVYLQVRDTETQSESVLV